VITLIYGRDPDAMDRYAQSLVTYGKGDMLLEFPEEHLYPLDHLPIAERIAAYHESGYGNVVCATQSEIICLRIQRRVREGSLAHKDVRVVWIENGKPVPLRMDEHGLFIDEWPWGFFEDNYREHFSHEKLGAVDKFNDQAIDDAFVYRREDY